MSLAAKTTECEQDNSDARKYAALLLLTWKIFLIASEFVQAKWFMDWLDGQTET
jgi:hypothetical protein